MDHNAARLRTNQAADADAGTSAGADAAVGVADEAIATGPDDQKRGGLMGPEKASMPAPSREGGPSDPLIPRPRRVSWCAQMCSMLRRNYLIKSRTYKETSVELCLPLVFFLLLALLRVTQPRTEMPKQLYPYTSVVGVTSFLQKCGCLAYTSTTNDPNVERVMNVFKSSVEVDSRKYIVRMNSSEEILTNYKAKRCGKWNMPLWAAIIFDTDRSNTMKMSIRINGSYLSFIDHGQKDPRNLIPDTPYADSGFLSIQIALSEGVLALQENSTFGSSRQRTYIRFKIQPARPFYVDPLHSTMTTSGAFYFVLGFFALGQKFLQALVLEKEKKIKEGMKIMGLSTSVYYVSWYVTYGILVTIPCAGIAAISGQKMVAFFIYTSPIYFFLLLWLYLQSIVAFCFLASTFFDRSRTAGQLGQMIILLLFLPKFLLSIDGVPNWLRHVASISSPIAFAQGFEALADAEAEQVSVGIDNWHGGSNTKFGYGFSILHLLIDTLLYLFLAWWVENIWQSEYGVAKNPCFCLMCCFQSSSRQPKKRRAGPRGYQELTSSQNEVEHIQMQYPSTFKGSETEDGKDSRIRNEQKYREKTESLPPLLNEGVDKKNGKSESSKGDLVYEPVGPQMENRENIEIIGLTKEFDPEDSCITGRRGLVNLCPCFATALEPKPSVKALDGLSIKIYKGEILALLGHNGAGKSTTIGVLTGLLPSTSGRMEWTGGEYVRRDLEKCMDEFRRKIGVCPQHDILFDDLTIKEHLEFYAALKGVPSRFQQREVRTKLNELELHDKRNASVKTLSGGQKRRLSIAIALIGGSQFVFLDEPTAGVDPLSRHQVWYLLQRYKRDRTIILTTHHMDEADLLGDRIAILSKGKLRCHGTSLFLKNHFGNGYRLDIVKTSASVPSAKIEAIVSRLVPGSTTLFEEDDSLQLSFVLPYSGVAGFSRLFKVLEEGDRELGIAHFGISLTTLEEVFLKIAEEEPVSEDDPDSQEGKMVTNRREGSGSDHNLQGVVGDSGSPELHATRLSVDEGDVKDALTRESKSTFGESKSNQAFFLGSGANRSTDQGGMFDGPLCALINKRLIVASREKRSLILQFFFPVLYVVFLLVALKTVDTALYSQYLEPESLSLSLSPPAEPFTGTKMPVAGHLGASCDFVTAMGLLNKSHRFEPSPYIPYPPDQLKTYPQAEYDFQLFLASLKQPDFYLAVFAKQFQKYNIEIALMRNATAPHGWPKLLAATYNAYMMMHTTKAKKNPSSPSQKNYSQSPKNSEQRKTSWLRFRKRKQEEQKDNDPTPLSSGSSKEYCPNSETHRSPGSYWQLAFESFPLPYYTEVGGKFEAMTKALLTAVTLGTCFASIPITSLVNVVREKEKKLQLLFRFSGVRTADYWGANLFVDMLFYTVPVTITYGLFAAFHETALTGGKGLSVNPPVLLASLAIFVAYGIEGTMIMFVMSTFFEKTITAQTVASVVNVWGSIALLVITVFMRFDIVDGQKSPRDDTDFSTLGAIGLMCVLPPFAFMWAIYQLMMFLENIELTRERGNMNGSSIDSNGGDIWNLFSLDQVGGTLCGMAFWALFSAFYLYAVDSKICCRKVELPFERRNISSEEDPTENEDVRRERNSVQQLFDSRNDRRIQEPLVVQDLKKDYVQGSVGGAGNSENSRSKVAVNRLTFAVKRGECFGLLGPNGAGKSTSIKMLTGEEQPTEGRAFVAGWDVSQHMLKVHEQLGVCLQEDALVERMTGLEHLYMYARIRSLRAEIRERVVNAAIDAFGLEEHKNKLTSEYSGGNKRKLSCAIALIGWPKIVLLDEPSTGIDPVARRSLWNVIRAATRQRSVMLTTHSMEEAEALCTRMLILVNGRMKCIGSSQHLKSRYGTGYHLEIHTSAAEGPVRRVKDFVATQVCSNAQQAQAFGGKLRFMLPKIGVTLSQIFAALELNKKQLRVRDYSLSQTTLEQVFISFAKQQLEDESNPNNPPSL